MAESLPNWIKKRKEAKERREREAEEVIGPPTLEDIERLKNEGRPDFQDVGMEPTADKDLPPWFVDLLKRAGVVEGAEVKPVEERPRIKVPFGFEVRQIIYNQSGDAESILVTKKEKVGKILVLAALVGFVLGALTLLTIYSLPSSLPFKFPWW